MTATRIAPVLDSQSSPIELNPPCGGNWLRDADGGLTPADEDTARAAGLWVDADPEPTIALDLGSQE